MNLKLGQPLPAKFVVLLGDILITLASLSAAHLMQTANSGTYTLFRPVQGMGVLSQQIASSTLTIPLLPVAACTLLFLCTYYIFDLYDFQIFGESTTLLSRLLWAGALVLVVASAASVFYSGPLRQVGLLQGVATAITIAFAWRRFFSANYSLLLKQDLTAVIGAGPQAERIRSLMQRPESRYRFTGFVHTGENAAPGASVLGSISDLDILVERHGIRQLILATEAVPRSAEPTISYLKFQGVGFHRSPDVAMELTQRLPIELLTQSWFRLAEKSDLIERHFTRKIKRLSDVVLSCAALIICTPLLILCALAIRLESSGAVIFRQTRVGWHGKPFTIFKLRTMLDGSERQPQWAQLDDARATRVGRLLRRTHIDELPQLLNVLRGEMSLVGPRPERPEFVEQLSQQIPYYDVRHFLLPGITGWAQVNFRYGASVADARRKLEFDLYYVMHASLVLDLLVILKTIQVVLFMRGSR
jgi:exopolysaccharide biosynthesis polyprenyl glycosylphosphotransferase